MGLRPHVREELDVYAAAHDLGGVQRERNAAQQTQDARGQGEPHLSTAGHAAHQGDDGGEQRVATWRY